MNIKKLLKAKGLTAKQLAAELGMTETGLSLALRETGNPPLKTIRRIAEILGVEVWQLFAPTDECDALIDHKGDLHHFRSLAEIRGWLDSVD